MVTSTGRPQESHQSVRTRRTLALGALSVAVVIAAASASFAVLGFDLDRDRDSASPGRAVATPSESAVPAASTGAFGPGAPTRSAGVQPAPGATWRSGDGVLLSEESAAVDLDTGKATDYTGREAPDLIFRRTYLEAWGPGALQVRRSVTGPVNPESCRSPEGSWGTVVDATELARGVLVCVRTNEERLGAITVTDVRRDADNTALVAVTFSYVIFR